jgi:hypothetical protein
VSTPAHDAATVDVVISADNGPAFKIANAFSFVDQGGNVMQRMGESQAQGHERY